MLGLRRGVVFLLSLAAVSAAAANILYEDVYFWTPQAPGGLAVNVVVNPPVPPLNAWVKIQETVYDDHQGRQVLQQGLGLTFHGTPIPAVPFNLYVYSVTNLTYGNGPVQGGGNGVSGFNIVNQQLVNTLGIWGPNAANSWWETPAGNVPFPNNWEWDIDGNNDTFNGDGFGVLQGQTFDSFMYAVPAGTQHGVVPAWVHTWSGGGLLQQPLSAQVDITAGGFVSGPIPEPSSILLVLAGMAAVVKLRRSMVS
ncbi:MAG: PEP-CTERM sorting domain-containing protein [Phycisphaerae bacterium]